MSDPYYGAVILNRGDCLKKENISIEHIYKKDIITLGYIEKRLIYRKLVF